jgi:hypothetical protein
MPPARLALVAAAVLFSAAPASAQLFEIARSSQPLNVAFSANAAFDPAHDCYFVVTREPAVTGHFIDRFGNIIGTVAFDPRGGPYVSRVTYSPDVSDGAGGHGGFVVIFTLESAVVAQIVSFPGRLVGPPVPIYGGPTDPVFIIKADIAYSPVDRGFLVALARVKEGLFPTNVPAVLVWLDLDAHPIRQTTLSSDPDFSCFNLEFFDECSEVGVAWNPISAEYGVLYTQGSEKALALVRSDGAILTRMALGIGTRFGALAVNTSTGNYLAVGAGGNLGECCDPKTDAAEVDPGGNFVARGAVTSTLQTGSATHALMGLSYLPASGTFLLVGLGGTGGDTGVNHVGAQSAWSGVAAFSR